MGDANPCSASQNVYKIIYERAADVHQNRHICLKTKARPPTYVRLNHERTSAH